MEHVKADNFRYTASQTLMPLLHHAQSAVGNVSSEGIINASGPASSFYGRTCIGYTLMPLAESLTLGAYHYVNGSVAKHTRSNVNHVIAKPVTRATGHLT